MIRNNIRKIMPVIGNVELVAVTKTRSIEEIKEAIDTGVKIIAENKIQEAEEKYNELKDYFRKNNLEFHFIGHLQANKVKKAVEMFDLIQSIDSVKLAKEIDNRAEEIKKLQKILLQVNIGNEKQKHGFKPEDVEASLMEISKLENVKVIGLMCIVPYFGEPEKTRPYFREMKALFDKLNLEILSMGMTNDYKVAIEEGSNMVRIGTGIFGERIK